MLIFLLLKVLVILDIKQGLGYSGTKRHKAWRNARFISYSFVLHTWTWLCFLVIFFIIFIVKFTFPCAFRYCVGWKMFVSLRSLKLKLMGEFVEKTSLRGMFYLVKHKKSLSLDHHFFNFCFRQVECCLSLLHKFSPKNLESKAHGYG